MYNKKNIFLLLWFCGLICTISAQTNDREKINQFILQGRNVIRDDGSTAWGANIDLIRHMGMYDSILKKEILDYILYKYKDSTAYFTRSNIIDLLSLISIRPVSWRSVESLVDPLWLRRDFFHAAMKFADHTTVWRTLNILNIEDYSDREKEELVRIFRRDYPFDAGLSYANHRMDAFEYESQKTRALNFAYRDNLDVDSLFNILLEQAYEKYRRRFENMRTPRALLERLAILNVTEIIPDLEAKLETTDSIEAYHVALALARMGNRNGVLHLINLDRVRMVDVIFTRNPEVVYTFAKRGLQDETEFHCNPDRYEEEHIFPRKFSTLNFLQRRIINMPAFLVGDFCNDPKYRDPEAIKAAKRWIEENRGNFQFE